MIETALNHGPVQAAAILNPPPSTQTNKPPTRGGLASVTEEATKRAVDKGRDGDDRHGRRGGSSRDGRHRHQQHRKGGRNRDVVATADEGKRRRRHDSK